MTITMRTIYDLEALPEDRSTRYELFDGELIVTHQPNTNHQIICSNIHYRLSSWAVPTGNGIVIEAPGVIFDTINAVAPDVVWISNERYAAAYQAKDGKIHLAPELMIEVLSPGAESERRDRVLKLEQYARFGVVEYWIVDRWQRTVEVYRRDPQNGALVLAQIATAADTLHTPTLPGFSCPVSLIFANVR